MGTGVSADTMRESANQPYFYSYLANNGGGNFTLPVDLNYEIDLWGRIRRGVTAAREQAQASAADMETVRLSLHAELATDYFGLRSADGQEKLLDDTIKAYSDAVQLTEDRFHGWSRAAFRCDPGADPVGSGAGAAQRYGGAADAVRTRHRGAGRQAARGDYASSEPDQYRRAAGAGHPRRAAV